MSRSQCKRNQDGGDRGRQHSKKKKGGGVYGDIIRGIIVTTGNPSHVQDAIKEMLTLITKVMQSDHVGKPTSNEGSSENTFESALAGELTELKASKHSYGIIEVARAVGFLRFPDELKVRPSTLLKKVYILKAEEEAEPKFVKRAIPIDYGTSPFRDAFEALGRKVVEQHFYSDTSSDDKEDLKKLVQKENLASGEGGGLDGTAIQAAEDEDREKGQEGMNKEGRAERGGGEAVYDSKSEMTPDYGIVSRSKAALDFYGKDGGDTVPRNATWCIEWNGRNNGQIKRGDCIKVLASLVPTENKVKLDCAEYALITEANPLFSGFSVVKGASNWYGCNLSKYATSVSLPPHS